MAMRPVALAAFAALIVFPGAAGAQTCGPLKQVVSIGLEDHGNFFAVPLTLNNTPRKFLLDTGGAISQISADTAKEMGLSVLPSRFVMYDMYGKASSGEIRADIGLGSGQTVKNRELQVTDTIRGLDGVYAEDLMENFDIDIDFAARKLNYFLTDHCDGRVVYWPASIIASVPFRGWSKNSGSHMSVPVKIDGHQVTAIVDTGASGSTLDAATARQLFDLSPDTPGAVPLGTMGQDSHKVFGWTFKTLEIGGITVTNPRMRILPELMGKGDSDNITADSHIRRTTDGMQPTMLIGMDVLRKLHLYIAFKEQKLYVTPASDQKPGDVGKTP
jgi:predicted aspartyl protease